MIIATSRSRPQPNSCWGLRKFRPFNFVRRTAKRNRGSGIDMERRTMAAEERLGTYFELWDIAQFAYGRNQQGDQPRVEIGCEVSSRASSCHQSGHP